MAILPGLFAGLLVISRISHLLQAFIKNDVGSKNGRGACVPESRGPILGVVIFAVCWLGVLGGTAYYILTKGQGIGGWFWFFVGMAATPFIMLPPVVFAVLRNQGRSELLSPDRISEERIWESYEYAITFDEGYIRSLIQKYLDQDPMVGKRKGYIVLFGIIGLVIWMFDLLGADSARFAMMALVAGLLSTVISYYIQRKILYSDLAYGSHMGKRSTFRLSSDGLEVEGARPYHETIWPDLIRWPNMLRAIQFPDGVFLWGMGGVVDTAALIWLPDSALVGANANRVSRLVKSGMQPQSVRQMK